MSYEIRTRFENESARRMVAEVKSFYGLQNDSELVRFLIHKAYREIKAQLSEKSESQENKQQEVCL